MHGTQRVWPSRGCLARRPERTTVSPSQTADGAGPIPGESASPVELVCPLPTDARTIRPRGLWRRSVAAKRKWSRGQRSRRTAIPTGAADPATVSYEFDYSNECGDDWRDSFYGGCSSARARSATGHATSTELTRTPTARCGGPPAFRAHERQGRGLRGSVAGVISGWCPVSRMRRSPFPGRGSSSAQLRSAARPR